MLRGSKNQLSRASLRFTSSWVFKRNTPISAAPSRPRSAPAATLVIFGPDFSKPLQHLRHKPGQYPLADSGRRLSRKTSLFDLRDRNKQEIALQEGRDRDHKRYIERETCMRALLYEEKLATAAPEPVVQVDKEAQAERAKEGLLDFSKQRDSTDNTMSSDNATTPLPESRLRQITVEVSGPPYNDPVHVLIVFRLARRRFLQSQHTVTAPPKTGTPQSSTPS